MQQLQQNLSDVLKDPTSSLKATIMFVDMTNSTEITAKEKEATWISHFAMAFDAIIEEIGDSGEIVKLLGDGAMVCFNHKDPAAAINCAIRIQERIKKLNLNEINCVFSIGISTGRVRRFSVGNSYDYLGTTCNKAARLCAMASSQAIIIDEETRDGANLNAIVSKFGDASDWMGKNYVREEIETKLKGIDGSVTCYEVQWDKALYGVTGKHISDISSKISPIEPQGKAPVISNVGKVSSGKVTQWRPDKGFCFIKTADGRDFFSQPQLFLRDIVPEVGQEVFFFERPPISEGKSPIAGSVVVVGKEYDARLFIPVGKPFLFAKVAGAAGEEHSLFKFQGDESAPGVQDQLVFAVLGSRFDSKANEQRPTAEQITLTN